MNSDLSSQEQPHHPTSIFKNWISLSGLALMVASFFAFVLLFFIASTAKISNPYVGILTYMFAPGFFFIGAFIVMAGAWLSRRQMLKANAASSTLKIDLSRPRDRRFLGIFSFGATAMILFTAVASYHSYHFTESVGFCGQSCHTVMEPEYVRYQHSPHARVSCAECHIGEGATWYVRSKLSGAYQVYATAANKYPKPVPTPIKNLRPAQETCEQCHWPEQFAGNLDRSYDYFLTDETNTPYTARMLLKVGGGNPGYGPSGGIHWHMNVANKVEYIATDPLRQKIPWVRVTDPKGVVREYKTAGFTNDISQYTIRTMDCMDCHNRPAHRFETPNDAVNEAIALGRIDRSLPFVKSNAVAVLVEKYETKDEALKNIATKLATAYPNDPRTKDVIDAVQQIYTINFFPQMKADWRAYPDNIGHKDWPGCFRCHDGNHKSSDGKLAIESKDCNACHVLLAQGSGAELEQLSAAGLPFKHPDGEDVDGYLCSDCHNGGL